MYKLIILFYYIKENKHKEINMVHTEIFKDIEKQVSVKNLYKEYKQKQTIECSKMLAAGVEFTHSKNINKIVTKFGFITVFHSNSKVNFPIINLESALTCSNINNCKYSFKVKRKNKNSNTPLCYAQRLEVSRSNVFNIKTYNAEVIADLIKNGSEIEIFETIQKIVKTCNYLVRPDKYVRFSEAGDIGKNVLPFAVELMKEMINQGLKPYTYTKSKITQKTLSQIGCIVIESDKDFVCVKNVEEAKKLNLPICPGQCGGLNGCYRCQLGKQTAVLAH
jgi:hypothetical protein